MTNERLRAGLMGADLDVYGVSERIGVDPKTVERWITTDRIPHRKTRLAVAKLLGQDDTFLWPTTAGDTRAVAATEAEFMGLHANRGSIAADLWTSLIDGANESIDLLAYAGSFLHDSVPEFQDRITSKARAGVQVRLLFGDPDSDAVAIRGQEEGIDDLLAARCKLTWKYLASICDAPGITARKHGTTLYNSIFRFDDELLVNTHSFGAAASQSPVLQVRRIPGGRLFTNYMLGFERTWDRGTTMTASSCVPARS